MLSIAKINYGMGEKNPVDHVHFYRRKSRSYCTSAKAGALAEREQREAEQPGFKIHAGSVSCLVPHIFQEEYLRVFCRSRNKAKVARAVRAFNVWCEQ